MWDVVEITNKKITYVQKQNLKTNTENREQLVRNIKHITEKFQTPILCYGKVQPFTLSM